MAKYLKATLVVLCSFLCGFIFKEISQLIRVPKTFYSETHTLPTNKSLSSAPTTAEPYLTFRETVTLRDKAYTYTLNLSQYEKDYFYLQSYTCQLLIDMEEFCRIGHEEPLFVIAIKSHATFADRREVHRNNWAYERLMYTYKVKPLYLLGTVTNNDTMRAVMKEAKDFQDILMWDFTENHHNLALKERCFLEWLHHHCKEAEFIFKGDDDEFLNPDAMVRYVQRTPNVTEAIHGNILMHLTVDRKGRNQVSMELLSSPRLPFFPAGGGYIMPGRSIPALYHASLRLPVFPLDDVYLGFLALAAGIPFKHDKRFYSFGLRLDICLFREAIIVHRFLPQDLKKLWVRLREPVRCDTKS
ncbi:UDP-GlcNAc:betaGal beta-1,3-N-acetylglucosaminyltransferase 7 [Microcaecilia unicolor]|uniref:Hexosyltransferase n=1 Tax=Microcaecilia unicolor TaxID=1415580 RepID=A0A6P7X1P3_9AMPH|nr:UDP-GlcNAc:betaGal beta-1,3-N-acetylglucosaminyltransferase 7-like [Microcaecilia unicolor]